MTTATDYQNYETPTQLLTDKNLSKNEKIALFECWAADEEALARAEAEGLEGGEQNRLAEIQKILMDLKD